MDQAIRNLLQRATQAARTLLEREFVAQLEGDYDILPDGTIAKKPGPHLDPAGRLVRGKLVEAIGHRMAGGQKAAEAVADYTREAAFTCLNRFVALKMLEARELVQTCVSKGDQSGGFREFCGLAPGLTELPDGGYQLYLECLFDELSTGVKVLFDRRDTASLLWPRRQTLLGLLEILNQPELAGVWIEDETIGWVYQYFNSQEERRQMREESQAPRNSRELAVRNQFFTPRYVVQFLTDNTLGRIWYEMRQGRTSLVEKCQYLVHRPDEVFLGHMASTEEEFSAEGCVEMAKLLREGDESTFAAFDARDPRGIQRRIDLGHCVDGYERHPSGEEATWQWMHERQRAVQCAAELSEFATQDLLDLLFLTCRNDRATDGNGCEQDWFVTVANEVRRRALRSREADLSPEELLRQAVFIPFRPKKDPRDLKILDPACGSGHFLLYCFDLLQTIYEEAWEEVARDPSPVAQADNGPLTTDYPTQDGLRAAVPSLILQRNLHGIDIDARCAQIAAFALWMRAQRAYNDLGLERDQRLPIRKTNIVVAEPMPGEEDLLKEFLRGLHEDRLEALIRGVLRIPPAKRVRTTKAMADSLCGLVRAVWDKMKLAGETGSLLAIEQALSTAVAKGREEWEEKLPLFRMTEYDLKGQGHEQCLRFVPTDGEDFWQKAESLVLAAMREFSDGSGYARRLFAEDTARGLAFIDVCRKWYDVVLMNPPFGLATTSCQSFIAMEYPQTVSELGASMCLRAKRFAERGLLGVIAPRALLLLRRLEAFRKSILIPGLVSIADLGAGVLDDAAIEVAAYIVQPSLSNPSLAVALDVKGDREKDVSLRDRISHLSSGAIPLFTNRYLAAPYCRLAYDGSVDPGAIADQGEPFEPNIGCAISGLRTFADMRFLRAWWEVASDSIGTKKKWAWFAKSDGFETFVAPPTLLVKWNRDGNELQAYNFVVNGQTAQARQGSRSYFRPGVSYMWRSERFCPRLMPRDCVFSHTAPVVLPNDEQEIVYVLGWLASELIRSLIECQSHSNAFTPGIIKSLPFCIPPSDVREEITNTVRSCVQTKTSVVMMDETQPNFSGNVLGPGASRMAAGWLAVAVATHTHLVEGNRQIREGVIRLSERIGELYEQPRRDNLEEATADHLIAIPAGDPAGFAAQLCSRFLHYAMGMAIGRWKAGPIAMRSRETAEEVDPFAAMPVAPRVMIVGNAFPNARLAEEGTVANWDGILVDDPGHTADVVTNVQAVARASLGQSGELRAIEAANLLGLADLREWTRRAFFDDHLVMYTKNRRKSPIYWEIGVQSQEYRIWLYYHRFTRDTIYKVLNDYVRPKLTHEEQKLARVRAEVGEAPKRGQLKELEAQEAFVAEIYALRDEIERIAPLWNPNFDDGIMINSASLWRLVPQHKAWQTECKQCWDSLVAGEYDWAHLAMHLWPERVVPKCRDDRSLAIAHSLEDLLWVEDYERWRAFGEPDDESEDQKKRRRLTKHDQLRSALAALAQGVSAKLTGTELWKKLDAGELDDTEAALLLWPSRVVEKCITDQRLADKLHVATPKRKSEAAIAKLIKRYETDGCGYLAEAVGRSLGGCNTVYSATWESLETGGLDDQPLALALWPDRVVDKCVENQALAETQGLARFFWYDDPWSKGWRRRQSPEVEVADEIAHRHKPAVKAALESLLSAPTSGSGVKKRRGRR